MEQFEPMTRVFMIDEEGFPKDKKPIVIKLEDLDPQTMVDVNKHRFPHHSNKPRWNRELQTWVEAMTTEELIQDQDKRRELALSFKLEEVKREAASLINEIMPLYAQVNAMRSGEIDEGKFLRIDNIRKRSNEIEEEIKSLSTANQIADYKIEF